MTILDDLRAHRHNNDAIAAAARVAAPVFAANGWKWTRAVCQHFTPDVADIAVRLAQIVESARRGDETASGRLAVELAADGETIERLSLQGAELWPVNEAAA